MSTTYRTVADDFTLTCDNGNGIFTVNAQTVFSGNVTYTVPATSISPFITVAANNTGTYTEMGLLGQTSANTFAGLRFNVGSNTWQISSSVLANGAPVSAYVDITTGSTTVAGANTQIQFNNAGSFGANTNLTYDFATSSLRLAGYQILANVASAPSTPANAVALYNGAVGGGGTGVYVLSSAVSDELVSKSKAIVYGIIF